MIKKILTCFMIFMISISNIVLATFEYSVPVWSETGLVREVSTEALRREFFEY